jgi:hypothetical protein
VAGGRVTFYEEADGTCPPCDEWDAIRAQNAKAACFLLGHIKLVSLASDSWAAAKAYSYDPPHSLYRYTHSGFDIWYRIETRRVKVDDVLVLACGPRSQEVHLATAAIKRFNQLP